MATAEASCFLGPSQRNCFTGKETCADCARFLDASEPARGRQTSCRKSSGAHLSVSWSLAPRLLFTSCSAARLGSPSLLTARLRAHSPGPHFLVSSICLNCFPFPDKLRSVGMETICGKFSQNKAPLDLGVQGPADTGAYFGRTFKVRRPGSTASCQLLVAAKH